MDEVNFRIVETPVEVSGHCPNCDNLIQLQMFRRKSVLRVVSGARSWNWEIQCEKCGSLLREYLTPKLYAQAWSDNEK